MTSLWSICLVSSSTTSNSNNRKIVKVNPAADSIQDLYRIAGEAFGDSVASLKTGFPPRPLESNDTTLLNASNTVSNQERVQVVLQDDGAAAATGSNISSSGKRDKTKSSVATEGANPGSKAVETTSSSSVSDTPQARRPKRAAAQAASASFAGVIREQDRILKAEKQPAKKKSKRVGSSSTASSKPKQQRKKAPVFASQAPGRRLADGAVVGSPAKPKTARSLKSNKSAVPSSLPAGKQKHEDMSVALLGALNDKGTMGRILRKGMSNAVQSSYESTKAATRLAALESRTPQVSVQMERVHDNSKLQVRFQKGLQGKGYFEEIVDWVPGDVLQQVVSAIYKSNPEGLRPQNLAFLSPRVLWALAFSHWETQQQRQQEGESWEPFAVAEAYRRLLPDKDWSFLRRRKQALSAKAVENLRQEQEEKVDQPAENFDEAAQAIQDVEHAMENLQQYDRTQRAERIANAAVARQQQQQRQPQGEAHQDYWKLSTPTELDEDELLECISTSTTHNPSDVSKLVKGLIERASIHNWRELANQMPVELHACLVANGNPLNISEAQVLQWIKYAREQSVEEIIVEICDGNPSHVELLHKKASSGTPKDLAGWKAMPDLLLEELGEAAGDSLALADLARFCDRSHRALQEWEWLAWFATPVE